MTKLLAALAFLGLNFYVYHHLATTEVRPDRETFASFPMQIGDWHCPGSEVMDDKILDNLGVSDYLVCNYSRREGGLPVAVYVGYHESQVRKEGGGGGDTAIHPPRHCLPGAGWNILDAQLVPLDVPGVPEGTLVNRFVIAKGDQRQLVWYWYQSRGRYIGRDWVKLIALFWDRATRQRTDGALVRFTVPVVRDDEERSEEAFRDFASLTLPKLGPYLPD